MISMDITIVDQMGEKSVTKDGPTNIAINVSLKKFRIENHSPEESFSS